MNRTVPFLAALIGVLVGAAVMLWWHSATGPGTRLATERVVHDYLLAHPEVIVEAMGRQQDGEAAKVVAANRAAIETPVGSAWQGDPHGDVTVVEYYDYNCGFCRASLPTLAGLLAADPHVRLVYREFPVLADSSRDAARLSLAAARQGRFQSFHDALYAAGPVTDATLLAAAGKAGVDVARARAEQEQDDAAIKANYAIARQLGMSGTPSFVIGDKVLVGALTLDQLKDAVAAARGRT